VSDTRPLDVVYDGDCALCVRALRLVRRLARRDVFRFHDANAADAVAVRLPELAGVDTGAAMIVVAPEGVYRGFFAFRRMTWASAWLAPLWIVFHRPGASRVGPTVYAWVARHRRRFGCRRQGSAGPVCREAPPDLDRRR
jgi:predicted DCC family thiol-disulfide oxidoreductase YuxK